MLTARVLVRPRMQPVMMHKAIAWQGGAQALFQPLMVNTCCDAAHNCAILKPCNRSRDLEKFLSLQKPDCLHCCPACNHRAWRGSSTSQECSLQCYSQHTCSCAAARRQRQECVRPHRAKRWACRAADCAACISRAGVHKQRGA